MLEWMLPDFEVRGLLLGGGRSQKQPEPAFREEACSGEASVLAVQFQSELS